MNMRKMIERLTEFDDNVIRTLIDRGHIKTGSVGPMCILYICDLCISEQIFNTISRYIEFCLFIIYCNDLPEVDYDRILGSPCGNLELPPIKIKIRSLLEMCSNVERILKYKASLGKDGVTSLLRQMKEPSRWYAPNKAVLKGVAGLSIHFENCTSDIELPMNFLFLKQEDIYLDNAYLTKLNLYTYAKGEDDVPTPMGVISSRNSVCTILTPGESSTFIPRILSCNSKVSFETSDIADKNLSIIKDCLIKLHQVTNSANPSIMSDAFRVSYDKSSGYRDIVSYIASPEVLTLDSEKQEHKLSGLVYVTVTPEYLKQNPQLLELHDLHITEGVYLNSVSSEPSTTDLKETSPVLKNVWFLLEAANSTIQFTTPTANTTIKYGSLLLPEIALFQAKNINYPLVYPQTISADTTDTIQTLMAYIYSFLERTLKTEEFTFEVYYITSPEPSANLSESPTIMQETLKMTYVKKLSPLIGAESISYISNKPSKSPHLIEKNK